MGDITKLLQIKYGIIQAPMAGGAVTSQLAAAVSQYGGLGSLASGYVQPDNLRQQIRQVKQLTTRLFQVNVFVPEPIPEVKKEDAAFWEKRLPARPAADRLPSQEELWDDFEQKINIIQEEDVPVVSFTFACPNEQTIHRLKQKGIFLIGTATTKEEALLLEEKGMDAIVLQGSEAGGHRGTFLPAKGDALLGLFSLISDVKPLCHVPLIAAGGITERAGVKAALALGADAVQIGTRFLASQESAAADVYKKAILQAESSETKITRLFSGKRARGIVNQWMEEERQNEDRVLPYPVQHVWTTPMRKAAAAAGNPDQMALWAGQGVSRIHSILTVEEIMHELTHI
ncbi:nitronate monooxygenase [Bacillus pumilus]|jgi:nitronate monooxygenase|uniref:nitronate monooxygenase n=2 Tax=Bacillus pumilus TaxID=1408 RepID=UPI0008200DE2|nr:nitronate monooxygenase [Bacillus pumilus]AOC55638.1 nitronate monooxygenase [Bacillus pumilus]MBR0587357.1 nitronate monooxygenase [Bacillus pumilus DW2J2]MBR0618680.1 nitronate monooxygenase [Bacillus pumilus]MBR0625102.1 nitronate monooxygenase [Bacillus pumilus]MCY7744519.1 nitronate monooxygenase [Bacillus pumilus]